MSSSPTVGSTNGQEPISMNKEATRHIQDHQGKQQQQQQQSSTIRTSIGRQLSSFSNFVNDNLIAARYGTFATITFLTAYGLSRTPLFFRFQTVADIPSSFFARRKTIYGRIVHVIENDTKNNTAIFSKNHNEETPIICLVRHSSPIERLLNRSSTEFFMRHSPSSYLKTNSHLDDAKKILKVEIAGVKEPPFHYNPDMKSTKEWLGGLAQHRTPISCTLLSRRKIKTTSTNSAPDHNNGSASNQNIQQPTAIDRDSQQSAICHIQYRRGRSIFRQDLGSSLVRNGRAEVITSGMHIEIPSMPTSDGSSKLGDLEADVKYIEKLASDEFGAVKEKKGIWAIDSIRKERPDLVEEAEFDKNAGILRKLWRKLTQR